MQKNASQCLKLYRWLTRRSENLTVFWLDKRLKHGKEDQARLNERKGIPGLPRPQGTLYWLHAASVGEAQSALILINALLAQNPSLHILVTTGTKSSAELMQKNLPKRALHQFFPVDHPTWTKTFMDHWHPDLIFWMESELWPNMILEIKKRDIPAILVNARLSPKSFQGWSLFPKTARCLLETFALILCQTPQDQDFFKKLGAANTFVTDNLKYSAQPLPCTKENLETLNAATFNRPLWVYASTHKGEETLAARIHEKLKRQFPDLLTIIIPRHPRRREEIAKDLAPFSLEIKWRSDEKKLPENTTQIYIADTFGELGLFYRATPIACIGRSFSDDGGGGHNPIEAAQLGCAVLHGPNVQNLQDIFDEMDSADAATALGNEEELTETLRTLFSNKELLHEHQKKALDFARAKEGTLERVLKQINPMLEMTKIPRKESTAR